MLEFHRKKYRMKIEVSEQKTIEIEYLQGTFGEILEMAEVLEDDRSSGLLVWLSEFISKSNGAGDTLTVDELRVIPTEALTKILNPILETFAKGYFQKIDDEKQRSVDYLPPDSQFICFILEHTNETLESLKRMTWESIKALNEGIVWNLREQTKEGKKQNKAQAALAAQRRELSDEDAIRITRELEKRMDSGSLNFQPVKTIKNG